MLLFSKNLKLSASKALLALACSASLVACSSSPDEIIIEEKSSLQAEYEKAKTFLEGGAYFPASEILNALDSQFPFGPHSHQVQLDLIYVNYKMSKSAQALASIDRFLRMNPNHQNIDYVHYLRGLVNIQLAKNAFQEAFGIERYDRDVKTIGEAFSDFSTIVNDHPDSKYAADARQRMVYLKDFMAKTEIAAAEYYIARQAYAAAANRAKRVVETFGETNQVAKALDIMVISYEELGLEPLKQNAQKVLKLNYPNYQRNILN
ncbi:outer membrane protein assembly factor BamD [Saccharobesus litoralis]|uniref:Outer membrane protein assembly factor BamD n=1 Tax=Saccharobesus litoralis TaxID=2172099 RepID=A0A2S0VSV9_9ALTE|nr:outer membrane protein assembly factor BamD [Saccharobesus litoralis]AWB67306.1 outer membrane protein assembly factor BamD [Saccharobesus litoralis]